MPYNQVFEFCKSFYILLRIHVAFTDNILSLYSSMAQEPTQAQPNVLANPYDNQYQQPYTDSYYVPQVSHPPMQQPTMFMPHQAQPAPQVSKVLVLLHFLFLFFLAPSCINDHPYLAVLRCLDQESVRFFMFLSKGLVKLLRYDDI